MRRLMPGSRVALGQRLSMITIVVALITFARVASAFRTSSDLSEFADQDRVVFDGAIELQLFQDVPIEVDLTNVESAAVLAARTWSAPTCTMLQMSFNGTTSIPASPGDGRNTVQWVSDWAARGFPEKSAGITDVQYARASGSRWKIVEADVYLNRSFSWSTRAESSSRDVLTVLTHELGHVAGLLHPCEESPIDAAPDCSSHPEATEATMFPIYSPTQSTLGEDDVAGLCFLYPREACTDASCATGQICGDDGDCHESCGDDWCRLGTTCDGNVCRPIATAPKPEPEPEGCLGDACPATRRRLGEECATASDCEQGRCLAIEGAAALCTRPCADDGAVCPPGWTCSSVDTERVCAPTFIEPRGGCAFRLPPSTGPYDMTFICSLLLLFVGRACASARRKSSQ